jgi:hypothetical protein
VDIPFSGLTLPKASLLKDDRKMFVIGGAYEESAQLRLPNGASRYRMTTL